MSKTKQSGSKGNSIAEYFASLPQKIGDWFKSIPSEIHKPNMNEYEILISAITFLFDCVYRALLEFAKLVLLLIVIIVSCQVFSRLVLSSSIMWSEEVALLLMVWIAFIAMAIGVEKGLHIAITIFYSHFPKKMQWVVSKINTLATVFFGYILVVYGSRLVSITMSSTLPATQWPAGTAYLMMPVGGVMILYFAILELFGLSKYRHTRIEDGKEGEKTDQQIIEEMRQAKLAEKKGETK